MTRRSFLWILTVTLPALAQAPPSEKISVVQMALHPAPEPQPALKYRLLPPISDQTPGNDAIGIAPCPKD